MNQPDLFSAYMEIGQPTARNTDPETSHMAAVVALPKAGSNRMAALQALAQAGADGLHDFRLAQITGVKPTSIGKRRKELLEVGLVEAALDGDGLPVRRFNEFGSLCRVWRITEAGLDLLNAGGEP